jgi:hypothetical protein
MSENNGLEGNLIDGLIAGIIDVQAMLALAICKQCHVEPADLAQAFVSVARKEVPGRSPEYISGRKYAASAVSQTLIGLGLPDQKPSKAKPIFDVIVGGASERTSSTARVGGGNAADSLNGVHEDIT